MENYIISPEDCFLLKAFYETKSLREAASVLKCDPAGLTRRVQHISSEYGLIHKVNNRWQLTSDGINLVAWTNATIESQKKILTGKSNLRIASTMWLSEIVLVPQVSKLKNYFEQKPSIFFSVPDKSFETSLIEGNVDFVIVCHPPESPEIEHKKIKDEEWAIIIPKNWKINSLEELKEQSFIRHSGMNTDAFVLEIKKEEFKSDIVLDNLIGIRAAVISGNGWSIVPKILVQDALHVSSIKMFPYDFSFSDRKVCLWWHRNRFDARKIAPKMLHWLKDIM